MKLAKITKRIFVLLLAVAWGGYALINGILNLPSLTAAYSRGWNFTNRLDNLVEAADGKVAFQTTFQDLNGTAMRAMGRQTINGVSIAQGADGQLLYTNFYPYEFHDYEQPARQMEQLALAAQQQGGVLLYLNCIDLYQEGSDNFGILPANNMNPRSDAFLAALQSYGVDYLDARVVLDDSSLSPADYRYKTEPHWTIEACFEAYAGLLEKLKQQGVDIDPEGFYAGPHQFTEVAYPQGCYLGKLGKIAGAPYAGYDDFSLIVPAYETSFTLSYGPDSPRNPVQGDFASTLLDNRWLGNDDAYDNDMYCAYLTEVYPFRKINNNLNPDGPKILVVGDSFMLPVAAFLATAAGEVHLLSPYSLPYGTTSLPGYLQENTFDALVVGLNPGTLSGSGFNFLNGIELPPVA